MNISHLVEKIKKGDNKSFEKLYKLTEREVWFTCISFLKNETTAQDIMQETYITAFLKICPRVTNGDGKERGTRVALHPKNDSTGGMEATRGPAMLQC